MTLGWFAVKLTDFFKTVYLPPNCGCNCPAHLTGARCETVVQCDIQCPDGTTLIGSNDPHWFSQGPCRCICSPCYGHGQVQVGVQTETVTFQDVLRCACMPGKAVPNYERCSAGKRRLLQTRAWYTKSQLAAGRYPPQF